jgi:hypothetical protein
MRIYAQVEMPAWIPLSSSYLPTTPSPMRVEAPPPTIWCHAIPWSTRTYKTRLKHVHLRIMHARRPRVLPSMDSDPIQFHLAPKPEISRTNYSRQRNSCTSCGSIQWRVRAWHVSYPVPRWLKNPVRHRPLSRRHAALPLISLLRSKTPITKPY